MQTLASDTSNTTTAETNQTKEPAPRKPVFEIPTIREYFMDLDYVLNVISDGPAKSYAYRRLKYLSGKWNLYYLMNEDEETSQMKRIPHRCVACLMCFFGEVWAKT